MEDTPHSWECCIIRKSSTLSSWQPRLTWALKHMIFVGVIMVSLLPHPSHKLQALDITVFSSLKTAYYSKCDRYMKLNPGRYQISHQFYVAYPRIATWVKQSTVLKQRGYILPSKPIVQQYQDKAEKKFAATKFQALAVWRKLKTSSRQIYELHHRWYFVFSVRQRRGSWIIDWIFGHSV